MHALQWCSTNTYGTCDIVCLQIFVLFYACKIAFARYLLSMHLLVCLGSSV